jgi:hypothetical protein
MDTKGGKGHKSCRGFWKASDRKATLRVDKGAGTTSKVLGGKWTQRQEM